ncbi:MAG: hypothetical protein ACRD1D_14750, partial [Acidimicrobiales bacterium]
MAAATLVAGVLLLSLFPFSASAVAQTGLQFLDQRPVVIDLDDLPETRRWRVQLFQGQGGGPHALRMHVIFQPEGVIQVVEPVPAEPVPTGEVASFVISLAREVAGSGELVVTSGAGAVARRPIRTAHLKEEAATLPSRLSFSGTRVTPFGGPVRMRTIDAPPGLPPGPADPVRLGTIASGDGDLAEVVREEDRFAVRGIDGPGRYEGTVDLLPGTDEGDVAVTVTVRDAAGWPLAVLVLGLLGVQNIERYQQRIRPRRDLSRRLAFLFDRARAAQYRVGGRMRVTGGTGANLFLDVAARDALDAWDRGRTEAEWSTWAVGGPSYQRIEKAVDAFKLLTDEVVRLERERDRLLDEVRAEDRAPARRALEESPVGDALGPASFATAEEIDRAAKLVVAGLAHIERFGALYEQLDDLDAPDVPDGIRESAASLRTNLLRVRDLDPVEDQTEALLKTWLATVGRRQVAPPVLVPKAAPVPSAAARADAAGPDQASGAHPGAAPPLLEVTRVPVLAIAAACVGLFVAVSLFSAADDAGDPGPAPSSTTPPPATTAVPDAPVATAPTLPQAGRAEDDGAGGSAVVGWGWVVPIVLGGAVVAASVWVRQRWRQRRPKDPEDFDSSRLGRMLDEDDFRFRVASGVFVVASGMS